MIGRTVGHYRILERLGAGGMGVVYKAEDLTLGRFVALKFLPPEMTRDPEAKGRFLREARAASQLDHSNICTIHEIGEIEDEQIFIAMAFYSGETLKSRIERGPLDVDDALKLAEQIARGLGKAHASGIVHRDIKPANVIVTSDGVAKILDFGLAKLTGATAITRSHRILGTLAYMAPEQVRGEEVGPQADLWSLGALLFELLTARRPFAGETDQAVIYAILNQQPSSLGELRAPVPLELDRIIRKLLRKDPLQRYQTAEEVLAELETLRAPSSGSGKSGPRASKPRESLRTGARLGPYEIVEPLGSGGMGDVYRARDTRLERQVAIKVLAPEFLEDAERKQRFQREAKTISSLSHPNICTLFDVGEQEGTDYLVMEYLEGETLADRLTRGALPLNDLLKIGIQIGEALGRAHQQGIVHRDLKPGNVMLTKAGAVKLLDFGLAKDIGAVTVTSRRSSGTPAPDKPLTAEGAIVGTLSYMAPEQVEGREADARADIFAFGAILYEMATGKRAFEGATKASLIVAILEKQPPLLAETRGVNESSARGVRALATIEHVVRQCLEKDPDQRWQNAIDIANELRWVGERRSEIEATEATHPSTKQLRSLKAGIAALALLLVGAVVFALWREHAARAQATRAAPPLPRLVPLTWEQGSQSQPAISPDGASFVYTGGLTGTSDIYFRRIGGETSINLTKDCPVNDSQPAFSPDGGSIAFRSARDGGGIFIMGATGESVRRLTNFGMWPSWSPDGKSIAIQGLAGWAGGTQGIWVVDVVSGVSKKIFDRNNVTHPVWSPSGARIAYLGPREQGLGMFSIWTIPTSGGDPVKVCDLGVFEIRFAWASGWIWYLATGGGTSEIWRVRVDETSGAALAPPELVTRQITGRDGPSVSADGRRVLFDSYLTGVTGVVRYELDVAHGRVSAEPQTILAGTRPYPWASLSPDGEWLATWMLEATYGRSDIVLIRTSTGETRRLTNDDALEDQFFWAPDGSTLYFVVQSETKNNEVWSIHPDGSGRELVASSPTGNVFPQGISADGRELYVLVVKGRKGEFGGLDLTVPAAQRKLKLPHQISRTVSFFPAATSPDGRWIVGGTFDDSNAHFVWGVLHDVAGKTYRPFADLESISDGYPVWLPDSRRIVFTKGSGKPGILELCMFDRETGAVTSIGSIKAGWLAVSADGRWVYANKVMTEESGNIWMLDSRAPI
jgi:serine/threonine protein kinase/Tol biopolymer transport system component